MNNPGKYLRCKDLIIYTPKEWELIKTELRKYNIKN